MIGNSSSGLIEAPLFGLPVVNLGDRQRGRLRGNNVIDVAAADRDALSSALVRACSTAFRATCGTKSPYGDGAAAPRIANVLATVELGAAMVRKRFVDIHAEVSGVAEGSAR